jgi:hypothetical protein
MTKKQYTILALLIFGLALLGFGILIVGAVLQDVDPTIPTGPMLIGFFGSLIAAIVLLLSNYSKLMRYEIERKIKKNESLENRKLRKVRMRIDQGNFESLIAPYKHGKSKDGLYWILRPNYMTQHMTFIVEFKDNQDMTEVEDEETKEDTKDPASDEADARYLELSRMMPKASNQGFHARVVFNRLDSVDDIKIAQAERIVTNAEIISRSFGMFGPILLYFLYDNRTGTLYYEPYQRYRMYPRPRALKMLLKMLGIPTKEAK